VYSRCDTSNNDPDLYRGALPKQRLDGIRERGWGYLRILARWSIRVLNPYSNPYLGRKKSFSNTLIRQYPLDGKVMDATLDILIALCIKRENDLKAELATLVEASNITDEKKLERAREIIELAHQARDLKAKIEALKK
jgi:hypothetical protein